MLFVVFVDCFSGVISGSTIAEGRRLSIRMEGRENGTGMGVGRWGGGYMWRGHVELGSGILRISSRCMESHGAGEVPKYTF